MKLRYCSDLHLEFNSSPTREQLFPKGGDPLTEILLIAGDTIPAVFLELENTNIRAISLRKRFNELLEMVSEYRQVLFIGGNHDAYYSDLLTSRKLFNAYLRNVGMPYTKMRMFENEAIELAPRVILLAATLWTDMNRNDGFAHETVGKAMNDFSKINYGQRKFTTRDAVKIHKRSLKKLSKLYRDHTLNDETKRPSNKTQILLMTHHQPSAESVKGSVRHGGAFDYGYYSDLTDWVLARPQISHWIAGHTHHNGNYLIGNTTVLTNCRGYGIQAHKDRCFDSFSLKPMIEIYSGRKAKEDISMKEPLLPSPPVISL